ncbi:hypothetical protein ABIE65_005257 [Constrictibacter sp. MBR-5]|uniref:hypothetical protein n=1 Tax=Constrictibacter sp. MBR-5 TaxID=3156467 RepID=UPI003395830F
MLADEVGEVATAGTLEATLHLPGELMSRIISFIASTLPGWRDDPKRPVETSETKLTAQLCARLNSASRHSAWDFLQFKQEEPDAVAGGRTVDLAVAPRGHIISIRGRRYSEYETMLPIECKRLPTPSAKDRDPREYLYSQFHTAGGVDRFKRGHHGANHTQAAMIGYIQVHDVAHWRAELDAWVDGLEKDGTTGWAAADKLGLVSHDLVGRAARMRSTNSRVSPLDPIVIEHLWIEMASN